jgi:heme/copper-type cytochrome/quinol oxidase subunit 1
MRRYWWLVAGAVLVVVGAAMVIASHAWGESSFGWFAYAPLNEGDITVGTGRAGAFEEYPVADTREMWAGISLVVAGLLGIAVGIGYCSGLRKGLAQRAA